MSKHESIGKSDEWYTPKYIFDALNCRFDLDVACPSESSDKIHTPCDYYIDHGSLSAKWEGFIWMNPPFGGRNGLEPWLDKFFQHGNGIALTPDRTSAPWWQTAARKADAILQVDGKIKFISGDGKKNNHPGNGTTLFASGEKGIQALLNAQRSGLGILFQQMTNYQYSIA